MAQSLAVAGRMGDNPIVMKNPLPIAPSGQAVDRESSTFQMNRSIVRCPVESHRPHFAWQLKGSSGHALNPRSIADREQRSHSIPFLNQHP